MHLGCYFAPFGSECVDSPIFLTRIQEVKMLRIQRIRILSTDCKVAKIGIKNKSLRRVNFQIIMLSDDEVPEPEGELMLVLKERVQMIIMWLNQNFLLTEVPNHLKKLST